MRKLMIAIVGAGFIGKRHLEYVMAVETAAAWVLVDPAAQSQLFAGTPNLRANDDMTMMLSGQEA
jgi:predicted dehydrogenase